MNWVPLSKASETLQLSQSKLSRLAKKGTIQTRKSKIDERLTLVNLEEIRSLFEEETAPGTSEQSITPLHNVTCSHLENHTRCTSEDSRTCSTCGVRLCFPHSFQYDGLDYCASCLPAYDKHQQW